MKNLEPYRNKHGEIFEISVQKIDISSIESGCWGYKFLIRHSDWGAITRWAGIKKQLKENEQAADLFIEDKPLEKLKSQLDTIENKEKLLLWSDDSQKGWFVV